MKDFNLNLIRKSAGELLDHVESYYNQLCQVPNHHRRRQLVELLRWLLQRVRELLLMIENCEPE